MRAAAPPPPDDSAPHAPFAPRARRTLAVFGAAVELVWLPERAARPGRPGPDRPAFREDLGARIAATEALERTAAFVRTPNKFPFAGQQSVLWSERPLREPDADFLTAALRWLDARGGTLLGNSIGAAASIPRAHVHHTVETLPFLSQLEEEPWTAEWLPRERGVAWWKKRVPFCLVGVRGDAEGIARAVAGLQMHRMTAAVNVVATKGEAWVFPRAVETPLPHFPFALGAAEVWGRWCYVEERAFAEARREDLERALTLAGLVSPQ